MEERAGWLNRLSGDLRHWKFSLFVTNYMALSSPKHMALLLLISKPQMEASITHGSEGLKSSKGDLTLSTEHRAGGPDYQHGNAFCFLKNIFFVAYKSTY